ncbi:MAG: hypothetical protein A2Y12_00740 [Planctomycetes bacterium GWF2_42_9]|nr:MAG: hypothetical protein A2Y12_00740 [Planctomycetes bacterium GWF2_42_9]HAL44751.1 hypothetical protein [Phycisphaerales bacterium]
MSAASAKSNIPRPVLMFLAAVLAWWIPGAGHLLIGGKKRGIIIFISLVLAFVFGIFIGSIGVIDFKSPWFYAQILFSPITAYLGYLGSNVFHLSSYGRPCEIGEIYTGIAGMMNLLCIVNAVYLANSKGK